MEGEGEGAWLGGQWKEEEKVFGLVANGRRRRRRRCLVWWPMEGEGKGSFLPLPLFPQATLLKPSFFILHIKVLLCPGPRPLFTPSLRFPWPINYDHVSWCHNLPHLHCWFDFVEDLYSLPCNHGVVHSHLLRAPNHSSEWRTAFGVIFRFDPNTTSSQWRTRTSRSACSSWSWTPSSLVLPYFAKLPHPGDLATSWPRFRWRTRNCLWRLLWNRRHFYLRMVFNSRRWTLSLATRSDSSTTS